MSKCKDSIKVIVGEYDVNILDIKNDSDRFLQQGNIYYEDISTMLHSGVRDITFWGIVDSESWYETGETGNAKQLSADALLFDDSYLPPRPKMSYYAVLKAIYDYALSLQ